MLEPLLGLPGRIKILLDRIGSNTPTQLGRLDANVSSRAPASTALSTSQWTNTKAGYLDAAISGRASQASVNALPQGIVKSVQRGTFNPSNGATSANVTISSVDLDKAFLVFSFRSDTGLSDFEFVWTGKLTSATNINFQRYTGVSVAHTIEWQVIEYV
jgi:hypothetical protein